MSLAFHLNHNHKTGKLHWLLISAIPEQFQRLFHHFSLLLKPAKSTDDPHHVLHLVLLRLPVRPSQRWASQCLHRMRYYALRRLLPWGQHLRLQHNAQLLSRIARLPVYSCSELHRNIIKSTTHNGAHRKQHDLYPGPVARPRSQFRRPLRNQELWRNLHVFLLPMQWWTQGLQRPATLRDVQPCCLQRLHTSRQVIWNGRPRVQWRTGKHRDSSSNEKPGKKKEKKLTLLTCKIFAAPDGLNDMIWLLLCYYWTGSFLTIRRTRHEHRHICVWEFGISLSSFSIFDVLGLHGFIWAIKLFGLFCSVFFFSFRLFSVLCFLLACTTNNKWGLRYSHRNNNHHCHENDCYVYAMMYVFWLLTQCFFSFKEICRNPSSVDVVSRKSRIPSQSSYLHTLLCTHNTAVHT